MSVSGVGSTPGLANVLSAQTTATNARAADGDYKTRNSHSAQTKDADGDYKRISTTSSPAAVSSSAVQAALSSLKTGG